MFCRFCGKEIPNDAKFCIYCGEKVIYKDNEETSINEVSEEVFEEEETPIVEEAPIVEETPIVEEAPIVEETPIVEEAPIVEETSPLKEQPSIQPTTNAEGSELTLGFKWYNFVVKVQLWLSMLASLAHGANYVQGLQYDDASLIYKTFPAMKAVDVVYGIIMLGLAAFTVYTRTLLKRFDAKGPKCYIGINIFNAFHPLMYALVCSAATKISISNLTDSGTIVRMIAALMLAGFNIYYFNKRKSFFSSMNGEFIPHKL